MKLAINKLWWAQIRAVVRLEMRKTFFARRGVWIYIVALLPVLIFVGYDIATASRQNDNAETARKQEKVLNYQQLLAVNSGMTKQEILRLLGKPPVEVNWTEHVDSEQGKKPDIVHEHYEYSDGQNRLMVNLTDDKVEWSRVQEGYNLGEDAILFAGVFQFFFLRLAVFFGCLGIFMNLFRGEILDRSLHFYFLAPIRREVLTIGKFLAGLLATATIFGISELLQNIVFWWHFPPAIRDIYLYHNHGLEHAAIYLGITVLACIGYGSFFLICGMLFRNPILPTVGILIWEAANPFLPTLLKQFSVIYYLKSLCPVEIPVPPDTPPLISLLISNSEPIHPAVAIVGVLVVAVIAIYASSWQVRRMEINYTTE